ncbi:hypothetical protein HYV85_06165 [Candidatus Woesearchaeota archaeon]|nr:hypothetical protein [Candidatus Woesearchaeota archaeon]
MGENKLQLKVAVEGIEGLVNLVRSIKPEQAVPETGTTYPVGELKGAACDVTVSLRPYLYNNEPAYELKAIITPKPGQAFKKTWKEESYNEHTGTPKSMRVTNDTGSVRLESTVEYCWLLDKGGVTGTIKKFGEVLERLLNSLCVCDDASSQNGSKSISALTETVTISYQPAELVPAHKPA